MILRISTVNHHPLQRERNGLLKHVMESTVTEMPALIAVEFAANQVLQVEEMVREKLKMGIMIRKASKFVFMWQVQVFSLSFRIAAKLYLFEMQKLFKTLEIDIYAKFRQTQEERIYR